jgi:predicted Zn-dependent protease
MKGKRKLLIILSCVLFFLTCETNPLTGETTLALMSDEQLFALSSQEYKDFLSENPPITGTADAKMVKRIGEDIRKAAEKWYASIGEAHYLDGYDWEYNLVDSKEVNAWCMPGGKIVVYTGILPITKNEDALATVMGHEVAHALLNHGKQRVSANFLLQLGALGVSILTLGTSEQTQELFMLAYGVGSTLGVMLPFSREHESEADHYGLILMAIAGYNPDASVPFWQRMNKLGSGGPEFLSTHPSPSTRIKDLQEKSIPEAKEKAAELNKQTP